MCIDSFSNCGRSLECLANAAIRGLFELLSYTSFGSCMYVMIPLQLAPTTTTDIQTAFLMTNLKGVAHEEQSHSHSPVDNNTHKTRSSSKRQFITQTWLQNPYTDLSEPPLTPLSTPSTLSPSPSDSPTPTPNLPPSSPPPPSPS